MSLYWPLMLLAGLAIVGAAWFAHRRWPAAAPLDGGWRGPKILRGFAGAGRLSFRSGPVRSSFPWRFWLGAGLILIALARPQWGPPEEAQAGAGGEVMIALDLSRSMLAEDVAPTRLGYAKALAARLAYELPDRRLGLIGFAAEADLLAPLTDDLSTIEAYLADLGPQHVLAQGTDFAPLLDLAAGAFTPDSDGHALVILSDGETEDGAWRASLPALEQAGVRVVTVGIGGEAGATVPDGEGGVLTNGRGEAVTSRLAATPLRAIAEASSGAYVALAEAEGLTGIVHGLSAGAGEGPGRRVGGPERGDRFMWFLAAAILMLVWSAAAEWPALPDAPAASGRRGRGRVAAGLAAVGLPTALAAQTYPATDANEAAFPQAPTPMDLQVEPDPLDRIREVLAQVAGRGEIGAADYLALTEAALRYGEIHRGHAHHISEGVLEDGLKTAARGRALDPELADWAHFEERLNVHLEPPPPVPEKDPDPADPANEQMEARMQVDVPAGEPEPPPPETQEDGSADGEDGDEMGGGRPDRFDEQEWLNATLVLPLQQLEALKAAASPSEFYLARQARAAEDAEPQTRAQTW